MNKETRVVAVSERDISMIEILFIIISGGGDGGVFGIVIADDSTIAKNQ